MLNNPIINFKDEMESFGARNIQIDINPAPTEGPFGEVIYPDDSAPPERYVIRAVVFPYVSSRSDLGASFTEIQIGEEDPQVIFVPVDSYTKELDAPDGADAVSKTLAISVWNEDDQIWEAPQSETPVPIRTKEGEFISPTIFVMGSKKYVAKRVWDFSEMGRYKMVLTTRT